MKKTKYFLASLLLAFSVCVAVGCGEDKKSDNGASNNPPSSEEPNNPNGGGGENENTTPETPSEGLVFTPINDGEGYEVSSVGTCTDKKVIIPTTYNGLPVLSIGVGAFQNYSKLTSISIPDSVVSVGGDAFLGCSNLSYNVYDNVKYLGNKDNRYLVLAGVKDKGITSCATHEKTKVIADGAFNGCNGLTDITLGDNVETIGARAFQNCVELTTMTIPEKVKTIRESAFSDCDKLANVRVGDNVETIGNSAFSNCDGLTDITIGEKVATIGNNAFSGCKGLKIVQFNATAMQDLSEYNYVFSSAGQNGDGITLTVGASVTKIPAYLFYPAFISSSSSAYPKVTSVVFAEGSACKTVCANAFNQCRDLTSVTLGESVETIDYRAFDGCKKLTNISIPDSILFIGEEAFRYCEALQYNTNDSSSGGKYLGNTDNPYVVLAEGTNIASFYVHEDTKMIGNNAFDGYNKLTTVSLPAGLSAIGDYAFSECLQLNNVCQSDGKLSLPDGLKVIGERAFYNCSNLYKSALGKLEIPDGVTFLGDMAFYHCTSLKSITIGDGVKTIGNRTFYYCNSVTSVAFGDGVETIGNNSFEYCTELTSIAFSDNIKTIEDYAFKDSTKLTSITIPQGVTSIGKGVFHTNLESISVAEGNTVYNSAGNCLIETASGALVLGCKNSVIPTDGSVRSIGDFAFSGCKITSIVIPETVTSIGDSAFSYCEVTAIALPEGVKTIGASAFAGCKFTSVVIPDTVISIGESAFSYCAALTSVTLGNSVETIGVKAFQNCGELTSISIPDTIISIGEYAFLNCAKLSYETYENAKYLGNANNRYLVLMEVTDTSITSCTIHANTKIIADIAFYGCTALTNIDIPDGVTSIGNSAFAWCSSLESIVIPDSVTLIGGWAFGNCALLSTVYYGGTDEQWSEIVWADDINGLTNATIYYYSDTQTEGGWHYVAGVPTAW